MYQSLDIAMLDDCVVESRFETADCFNFGQFDAVGIEFDGLVGVGDMIGSQRDLLLLYVLEMSVSPFLRQRNRSVFGKGRRMTLFTANRLLLLSR